MTSQDSSLSSAKIVSSRVSFLPLYLILSPNHQTLLLAYLLDHPKPKFILLYHDLHFFLQIPENSNPSSLGLLFFYYFDNIISLPQTSHHLLPLFCTYATLSVMDVYNVTFKTDQSFLQICSSWLWGPQCNGHKEPWVAEEIWEGFITT